MWATLSTSDPYVTISQNFSRAVWPFVARPQDQLKNQELGHSQIVPVPVLCQVESEGYA